MSVPPSLDVARPLSICKNEIQCRSIHVHGLINLLQMHNTWTVIIMYIEQIDYIYTFEFFCVCTVDDM